MRRCTLTDKRAAYKKSIALIISFAMLASTFYVGPAFAAENPGNDGEDANTKYTQPEVELQTEGDAVIEDDTSAEVETIPESEEEIDEGIVEDGAEPELQPDAVTEEPQIEQDETEPDQSSVKTMAIGDGTQPLRVVLQTSANKQTLLQPDSMGRYYFNSKISKLRDTKSIKILISNPAECSVKYSDSNMAGNTGGEFLEANLINHTVDDPQRLQVIKDAVNRAGLVMGELNEGVVNPDPEPPTDPSTSADPEEPTSEEPGNTENPGNTEDPGNNEDPIGNLQVTEVVVKINGTGQDSFTFKASGSEEYAPFIGKIIIGQTRPTSVISRGAKVKGKSVRPKTIGRSYREKYFKIVKKGDNDQKIFAYRTVKGAFEIKRASGVSEGGYRAVQGGNTDGTYAYTAMGKKGSKTYGKIVKTRLSDMKVVKVSKNLKINHANDITFDPAHCRLVVTHNDKHRKRVSFVNPKTLKVTGHKDIAVPATLKGATKAQLSAIGGFSSVTYMRDGKYAGNYIAVISGVHNFLVLNSSLKPIEYITVSTKYKSSQVYYQGADNINGNLYISIFPRNKKYKNMICIYDMDGEFKGKITLIKGFELENVFHAGGSMYVTLYKKVKKV